MSGGKNSTQVRTEALLHWIWQRSQAADGKLEPFSQEEAAAAMDIAKDEMQRFGTVRGNIQSRIDFACYLNKLPPLGLVAEPPFARAWIRENRDWDYPVEAMQAAARARAWATAELDEVLLETEGLPAQVSWKNELANNEAEVRAWAESFTSSSAVDVDPARQAELENQLVAISRTLATIEDEYRQASPDKRDEISRKVIERGPVGALLKRLRGFRCQICEQLGLNPHGFRKPDGEPYAEAHHVLPVSRMEPGSLSPSNVIVLCANHHRQMHYGEVSITAEPQSFEVSIDGKQLRIARWTAAEAAPEPKPKPIIEVLPMLHGNAD